MCTKAFEVYTRHTFRFYTPLMHTPFPWQSYGHPISISLSSRSWVNAVGGSVVILGVVIVGCVIIEIRSVMLASTVMLNHFKGRGAVASCLIFSGIGKLMRT